METGGRAEMRNELVLYLCVADKYQKGYLSYGGPPWGVRGPRPTLGPPNPGFHCQEEKVPWLLAEKTSRECGWVRRRASGVQAFFLKGLCTNLHGLTCSELQSWGSSSKCSRNIQKGTEYSGFRMKAGGAVFSQRVMLAVHFLSHPPQSQWAGATSDFLSAWLILFILPWFPWNPTPPNFHAHPSCFHMGFLYKLTILTHAANFHKISQSFKS